MPRNARPIRLLLPLLLLALGVLWSQPLQAQDTLRPVAVVNDQVISELDLAMRLRLATLSARIEETPEVRQRLSRQVLQTLIDERIKEQEADRLGIEIPEEQVNAAVASIAQRNGLSAADFERALVGAGVLPTVLKDQIRSDLAWQEVVLTTLRPQVDVTDAEVADLAKRVEAESGGIEIRLMEILLPVENPRDQPQAISDARRIMEEVSRGASFTALARDFSAAASAGQGGDLGWLSPSQLSEEVRGALQNAQPGQLVGPLPTVGGVYVLYVAERRQAERSVTRFDFVQINFPVAQDASEAIVASTAEKAAEVRSRLDDGCDSATAAIEGVVGAAIRRINSVTANELPPNYRSEIAALTVGQSTQPLRVGGGYTLLVTCSRSEEAVDIGRLRRQMIDRETERLARRLLRNLRRSATIEIRA